MSKQHFHCGHYGRGRWCHRCDQARRLEPRLEEARAARAKLPGEDPAVRERLLAAEHNLERIQNDRPGASAGDESWEAWASRVELAKERVRDLRHRMYGARTDEVQAAIAKLEAVENEIARLKGRST